MDQPDVRTIEDLIEAGRSARLCSAGENHERQQQEIHAAADWLLALASLLPRKRRG